MSCTAADDLPAGAAYEPLHPAELTAMFERLEARLQGGAPTREQWLGVLQALRVAVAGWDFEDGSEPDDA
jgi:hypothetical protein